MELLTYSKQLAEYTPFVVMTGYGSIESAVKAVKSGAFDYITKPLTNDQILKVTQAALKEAEERERRKPYNKEEKAEAFQNIITESAKMKELFV